MNASVRPRTQMRAARRARWPRDNINMLVIDPDSGTVSDHRVGDLPSLLEAGDLVVLNDAATLPASIRARTLAGAVELRLTGPPRDNRAQVVLFGDGDWRDDTAKRPPPPVLEVGSAISIGNLIATVCAVSPLSRRLVVLDVDSDALWAKLYHLGAPVQYSYIAEAVRLDTFQTLWAGRPWAVEPASAGRPLSWAMVQALRARGVRIATVTHAAGLSSTGDPDLDAALPLPERFDVPEATASLVNETRAAGRRVIAVGTTVVRALESTAIATVCGVRCVSARGVTDLRIDERRPPLLCDGLITGMHQPGESHFELACAFADRRLLGRAIDHATARGYLCHELGDLTFVSAAAACT